MAPVIADVDVILDPVEDLLGTDIDVDLDAVADLDEAIAAADSLLGNLVSSQTADTASTGDTDLSLHLDAFDQVTGDVDINLDIIEQLLATDIDVDVGFGLDLGNFDTLAATDSGLSGGNLTLSELLTLDSGTSGGIVTNTLDASTSTVSNRHHLDNERHNLPDTVIDWQVRWRTFRLMTKDFMRTLEGPSTGAPVTLYRAPVAILLIMTMALNILSLTVPLAAQLIFNRILPSPGSSTLSVVVGAVAILAMTEAMIRLARGYIMLEAGRVTTADITRKLLGRLITSDYTPGSRGAARSPRLLHPYRTGV